MRIFLQRAFQQLFFLFALLLGLALAPSSWSSVFAADHQRFRIGDIECIALSDGYFEGPAEMIAPEIPKTERDTFLATHDVPTETMVTPLQVLLLRLPDSGQNVLIDTGVGPGFSVATAGKLLLSLKEAGLAPEDIDYILISHLHQDHVNGAFDQTGRPVFPNASFYVSQEEVEFWQNPGTDLGGTLMPLPLKQSVIEDAHRFLALSAAKRHTFSAGEEVIPGVRTIRLPGHTPGQVGFLLQSRGESLLYIADAASNPFVSLQRPDWRFQNDDAPGTAAETRKSLIQLVRKENWTVFVPHFPWPGVGRLVEEAGQITFKPMALDTGSAIQPHERF